MAVRPLAEGPVHGPLQGPAALRRPPGLGGRSPKVLVSALALCWLLPLMLGALHLQVLTLVVALLAIGSLVRVGGGLVDRLMVSGLLLSGALMAFGLVASVWPWRLDPLPAGGVLLSVIALAGWYGDRRPRFALRLRWSDGIIAGTGLVVWHFVHRGVTGRLGDGMMMVGDRFSHFAIFESIGRIGGYLFLHQAAGQVSTIGNAAGVYPQGSHFLFAWVDVFVRSSTVPLSTPQSLSRYFTYVLLAFVLLCVCVVWATRWVAGPRLAGWRTGAVCAVSACLVLAEPLPELLREGFDSEIVGLAFVAVSVALLLRPAMGQTEYALVAAAGLVTVAYSYNIYVVFVALPIAAGLLLFRRRQRGHRVALLVWLAAAGAVALLPSAISVFSHFDVGQQSVANGMVIHFDRATVIGLGLAVILSSLVSLSRPTATQVLVLVAAVGTVAVLGVFAAWQIHRSGTVSYYFEKLALAAFVVFLTSLGSVGGLLRPLARRGRSAPLPRRLQEPLLAVGVGAAALSLFAGFQWGIPSVGRTSAQWRLSSLVSWSTERQGNQLAEGTRTFMARDMARSTAPVITLYRGSGSLNWQTAYLAQALLRRNGMMTEFGALCKVDMGSSYISGPRYRQSLEQLRLLVHGLPSRPTILVGNKRLSEQIDHDLNGGGVNTAKVLFAPLIHYPPAAAAPPK
ncbi:hypothetical protein ACEZCY_30185 [Streptacidiphilus sp. N1-12]|uniref:Uncharacterized protein n=2 Tax=Streptacidiphilus alkalitolerans TaxID=3342712 RepID=A0ABV6WN40_9ACTN